MISKALKSIGRIAGNTLVAVATLALAGALISRADYTFTQGVGSTAFDFLCFTTKHCMAHVNIDSTGTEIVALNVGTVATPGTDVLTVQQARQSPAASTQLTASATGTTGATTATLAGASSKTTYVCGFTITSDATAAIAGTATVTGTISGTMSYIQNVGGATAAGILTQSFAPCIPASATNTGIAINSVAAGTGGSTAVTAWGYQL